MKVSRLLKEVRKLNGRSYWERGVIEYAISMVEDIQYMDETTARMVERDLLNGASSWMEYSEGGCALCCESDIAERLCTPSELKRLTHADGSLRERPNAHETWFALQARALKQAALQVKMVVRRYDR